MMTSLSCKISCLDCKTRCSTAFSGLADAGVEQLNQAKSTNKYKRGQYIFYENNSPSGLYCVNSGVVKLESASVNGTNHILNVVAAGGTLGYRSLFSDEPYEVSALVHEDSTICYIPKEAVLRLTQSNPTVAMNFLSTLSKELRVAEGRFCGLTDKTAAQRTAEALLFLKDQFPTQTWSRKDIAEWAGTTPETVMRTLAQFESDGMVRLTGRKIQILNKRALLETANLPK